ncbi:hypothetical protein FB107DRAFT_280987 [Schizophyllum commune]
MAGATPFACFFMVARHRHPPSRARALSKCPDPQLGHRAPRHAKVLVDSTWRYTRRTALVREDSPLPFLFLSTSKTIACA